MGNCRSCQSTGVSSTAKLILLDGQLQEFSYPIKVSYVLEKNPAYFICNADEMEFNDVVLAVSEEEELQPGQLYFALPLSWLKRPLQPEQMAALAVKANSALMNHGNFRTSVTPILFPDEVGQSGTGFVSSVAGDGGRRRRRNSSSGDGRKLTAMLNAIPE
ncbi:hypothetical protein LINGRAPRIM_LOCUS933 [Linum grandiflorum]